MISTLIPIRPFYQTSAGMASVGNGRLRMRPPAHDHIRKVTLSQKKTRCRRPLAGREASKNHYYHGIYWFKTVMELKRGINITLGCMCRDHEGYNI